MKFTEAKEHAPGRLHEIFAAPYQAFDNAIIERHLHLRVALQALLAPSLAQGRLVLRVIHGWENGDDTPEALVHSDHLLARLEDLAEVRAAYRRAFDGGRPLPRDDHSLLAAPRDAAIAAARDRGEEIDEAIRRHPTRWPAFARGLSLYTFFKVYHRLTYGEDESYRSICCETPEGDREIHEFHLEECEFALCVPPAPDSPLHDEALLILHESQLAPLQDFLATHLVADG